MKSFFYALSSNWDMFFLETNSIRIPITSMPPKNDISKFSVDHFHHENWFIQNVVPLPKAKFIFIIERMLKNGLQIMKFAIAIRQLFWFNLYKLKRFCEPNRNFYWGGYRIIFTVSQRLGNKICAIRSFRWALRWFSGQRSLNISPFIVVKYHKTASHIISQRRCSTTRNMCQLWLTNLSMLNYIKILLTLNRTVPERSNTFMVPSMFGILSRTHTPLSSPFLSTRACSLITISNFIYLKDIDERPALDRVSTVSTAGDSSIRAM